MFDKVEGARGPLSADTVPHPTSEAGLHLIARLVRLAAEEELLPRFGLGGARIKDDGSLVTAADTGLQALLERGLRDSWPDFPLIGEEMSETEQRAALSAEGGVWCLDPVDGTTNFVNGLPFFAVSLAFLQYGQPVMGLVYDPVRQECFTAVQGRGAQLNGVPLPKAFEAPALRRCVALVDFKRLSARLAGRLGVDPPYSSQRNLGACALDWCWLAAGRAQLYLHGGQKLWDYAAGSLILKEVNGVAATLEGTPLRYDSLHGSSAVAARTSHLYEAWQAWISHNA